MAENSAIEWTNSTWNPVTGCTKLSAGCDHCYAERFSERFRGVPGHPFETGFDLTLRPERLDQPKLWRRPRLIFVNSMSDLFHKQIPVDYIDRVFATMEAADWHVYQVLTKRSSLMRNFVNARYRDRPVPPHIWLGVSVENASTLSRLRHLQETNASIRFVSFEPLLGSVHGVNLAGVDWVIAGGESGPGARVVRVDWLREIRDACRAQGAAFFFKQWGGRTPKAGGNALDGTRWLELPRVASLVRTAGVAGAPIDAVLDVGPWSREKLNCLGQYLHAYTTILRRQGFKGYFYVDAFAGPGSLRVRSERTRDPAQLSLLEAAMNAARDAGEAAYIAGSPRVALGIEHPFTDYVFIELDQSRVRELEDLKRAHAELRIHIRRQECNRYLLDLLLKMKGDWRRWRGVVFLDPFGMQVPWSTLAKLGETGAIEVFINFPVGMAIQRLLKRSGQFTDQERKKLDEYFGTTEWFDLLYRHEQDLMGDNVEKIADSGDVLVRWYRKRLKEIFGYVSAAREIRNTKGRPLYYLIFAGPSRTGARIAEDILRQGARVVR
jgi:three-Cys-motif partner protein